MIVVMEGQAPASAVESVVNYLKRSGCEAERMEAQDRILLSVTGKLDGDDLNVVRELSYVQKVIRLSEPFRLASRHFRKGSTVLSNEYGTIGGPHPWIAIEAIGLRPTRDSGASDTDDSNEETGPTSAPLPYRVAAGRPFDAAVTRSQVALESVGALACLSLHPSPRSAKHPVVFVARQPSWGADRWIHAAERELERSGTGVVLLEAGGEYPAGARTLEVAAIARAKLRTHLPIVVDVPTIAQQARYVAPVAFAAIGAGADGVILRVWAGPDPEIPPQPATLSWEAAVDLAERVRTIGDVVRR